jgi:hypothetical protein
LIYQCYPAKEDKKNVFLENAYKGFGLEPEVNKLLTRNCPELSSAANRLQLTEYACLLWHWRNSNYDTDEWIGTTSIRQSNKFPHRFKNKQEISELLNKNPVIAWGQYTLHNQKGEFISLEKSTEVCHPGLTQYMRETLLRFGHELPKEWKTATTGFFANYWIMTKDLFEDFMSFSWPMVSWSLDSIKESDFYKNQPEYKTVSNAKAVCYFAERLFLVWYLLKGITPHNPGQISQLGHGI